MHESSADVAVLADIFGGPHIAVFVVLTLESKYEELAGSDVAAHEDSHHPWRQLAVEAD